MKFQYGSYETWASAEEVKRALPQILGKVGYTRLAPKDGAEVFASSAAPAAVSAGPGRHRLLVTVHAAWRGVEVQFKVDTERTRWVSNSRQYGELGAAIRKELVPALPEGVCLYEGTVTPDGLDIDVKGAPAGARYGALENSTQDSSRFALGVYGAFGLFFTFIGVLPFIGMAVGDRSWTPGSAAAASTLGLSVAGLGWFGLWYFGRSFRAPVRVVTSVDGIVLITRGGKTRRVAWGEVLGLPQTTTPYTTFVRLVYKAEGGRRRAALLAPGVASALLRDRRRAAALGPMMKHAEYADTQSVGAGASVVVSGRALTRAEAAKFELVRRWVRGGPLSPVYVTREAATQALEAYISRASPAPDRLAALGKLAAMEGSWASAAQLLRAAIDRGDREPATGFHLTTALARWGKLDEADAASRDLAKAHPKSGHALLARAIVLLERGRDGDALVELGRAAKADPNLTPTFEIWLGLMAREEPAELAIADLDRAASEFKGAWAPELVAGLALVSVGKADAALPRLRKACEVAHAPEALHAFANVLVDLGRADDAVELLEGAAAKGPLEPRLKVALARGFAARGELRRARALLAEAESSDHPGAWWAARELRPQLGGFGEGAGPVGRGEPYGRLPADQSVAVRRGRGNFVLRTPSGVEETRVALRDSMLYDGYVEKAEKEGALRFSRGMTQLGGPFNAWHEVRVRLSQDGAGTAAAFELRMDRNTPKAFQEATATDVRASLEQSLAPEARFFPGVVAADESRVNFSGPSGMVSFSPTRNFGRVFTERTVRTTMAAGVGLAGGASLLVALLVLPQPPNIRGPFLVFYGFVLVLALILAIIGGVALSGSRVATGIVISPLGLRLAHSRRPEKLVPWGSIVGIGPSKSNPQVRSLTYNEATGAGATRTRTVPVSGNIEDEFNHARPFAGQLMEPKSRPLLEALNFAPPGTAVLVPDRIIHRNAVTHRKATIRYLRNGALYPLLVGLDDEVRIVREWLARNTPDPETLHGLSRYVIDLECWDLAAQLLARQQALAPDSEGLISDVVIALSRAGRSEDALAAATAWSGAHPKSSVGHLLLSNLHDKEGRVQEALAEVSKAAECDPNNLDALDTWFRLVAKEGEPAQALAEIDYLSSLHPEAWAPHLAVGMRMYGSREKESGRPRVFKALEISKNADTLHAAASILLVEKKPAEAAAMLEAVLGKLPIGEAAALDLVRAYADLGETDRALEILGEIENDVSEGWKGAARSLRHEIVREA